MELSCCLRTPEAGPEVPGRARGVGFPAIGPFISRLFLLVLIVLALPSCGRETISQDDISEVFLFTDGNSARLADRQTKAKVAAIYNDLLELSCRTVYATQPVGDANLRIDLKDRETILISAYTDPPLIVFSDTNYCEAEPAFVSEIVELVEASTG